MATKIPMSAFASYYTPNLERFLGELDVVASTMSLVEMVTPINASAEKARCLAAMKDGKPATPKFQYNTELLSKIAKQQSLVLEMWDTLPEITGELSKEEPGRILAKMATERCREVHQTAYLASQILSGDSMMRHTLKGIFGFPSDEIIQKAHLHAQNLAKGDVAVRCDTPERKARREALKAREFDAEKIRENFLWAAEQCGFAGSRPVEIDPMATAIDVRDKSSRGAVVVIPETRKVNGVKLVELTGHEICCHWGDSTRAGIFLPLLGSGNLKPLDETLYEGHAVMADFNTHANLGEKTQLCQKPWYVLAMELAREGLSFSEMAQRLYELVRPTTKTDEAAWNTVWTACYRVKRGSSGADCSYVLTKDQAYFAGRIQAEDLYASGLGNALSIATISVADLELLMPVVDFGEDDGHLEQVWALQEKLCDKLLAE